MEKKKFIQIFVLCDIFLLYTEPKTSYWTKGKKVTVNLVTEL